MTSLALFLLAGAAWLGKGVGDGRRRLSLECEGVGVLAPLEGLLVDWGSLLEEVIVGIEHGQALVDAESIVLQYQRRLVGLAVDISRLVCLLDKGLVDAGPEVEEDVEEVGRLETNSADHLEAGLLED